MFVFIYRNDSPIMHKRKILIDLDGVLNQYGNDNFDENYIPELRYGAKEFIKLLYTNFELYLFTSRNLLLASKWLINNDLDKYFKDVTNIKIPSFLYIDDRVICFNGNFHQMLEEIDRFKPYWNN